MGLAPRNEADLTNRNVDQNGHRVLLVLLLLAGPHEDSNAHRVRLVAEVQQRPHTVDHDSSPVPVAIALTVADLGTLDRRPELDLDLAEHGVDRRRHETQRVVTAKILADLRQGRCLVVGPDDRLASSLGSQHDQRAA